MPRDLAPGRERETWLQESMKILIQGANGSVSTQVASTDAVVCTLNSDTMPFKS